MFHVVTNLEKIDFHIENFVEDGHLKKWFSKQLRKEAVNRRDWLMKALNVSPSDNAHIHHAIRNGQDVFEFIPTIFFTNEFSHVADWVVGLEERDPRLFSKLDRITWSQANEHSFRWHEQMARRAERLKNETITFDDDCPIMFTHDDGMKWVWLKTDKARDDEGRIMGHCVGEGNYDNLPVESGVFSLRDSEGCPHVTVELYNTIVIQSFMKGNTDVSKKYQKYVDVFHAFMVPKLTLLPKEKGDDHFVWWNGDEEWYKDGQLHREDAPAVIMGDKTKKWFRHGLLHREDGPAIERVNGNRVWYKNNEPHREDGPALILHNGHEEWWSHGKKHRDIGPAVIHVNGDQEWWIDGKLHRNDGPAIEKSNGKKSWYENGELHREDGPAVKRSNGEEEWYCHGKLHRNDGPAVIKENGQKEYWINGKRTRKSYKMLAQIANDSESMTSLAKQ